MPAIVNMPGVSRSNTYLIPPEELSPGDNSRRWDDTEILELALDILDAGQLVPVLVAPRKGAALGQPQLEIVDGHRRTLAIRYINQNGLAVGEPLRVRCEYFQGAERFAASARANLKRKSLTPIDLAHVVSTLEKQGRTRKEIAKLLEVSEALISRTLTLLSLPVAVQKDIHAGKVSAEAGYELAASTPEEREEAMAASREEAKQEGRPEAEARPTRSQVRKAKQERAERGEQTTGPKARTRKEVYALFHDWATCEDGTIEEPIKKLCASVCKYMDGEGGDRAVLNRMRDLAEQD